MATATTLCALLARFTAGIWFVDFEFYAPGGQRPVPLCMVASELRSGQLIRLWIDDLRHLGRAPFDTGPGALLVAYYASAEIACFLALGWPLPEHVLDLFAEFRNATNGLKLACGAGLLGALSHHGLDSIQAAEKESMRQLAMRGEPYSEEEKRGLLDYCQTDVDALVLLLPKMATQLDLPRALLRGRYMKAAARIERTGIPIDVQTLNGLRRHWDQIKGRLVVEVDKGYGVYEGLTFKAERWQTWCVARGIPASA
ncbi:MAG TPA: hypothetical protein VGP72_25780 [Planctomycetota bacterium]|jgi:hypothetical protein